MYHHNRLWRLYGWDNIFCLIKARNKFEYKEILQKDEESVKIYIKVGRQLQLGEYSKNLVSFKNSYNIKYRV